MKFCFYKVEIDDVAANKRYSRSINLHKLEKIQKYFSKVKKINEYITRMNDANSRFCLSFYILHLLRTYYCFAHFHWPLRSSRKVSLEPFGNRWLSGATRS